MNPTHRTSRWLIALAMALLSGCGTEEIASRWHSSDLISSGTGGGRPAPAFDHGRMSGTVFNDSEYIYIGLQTNNAPLQRLVMREGITVWFDRDGGGKRSFGIRYPAHRTGQRQPEGGEERDSVAPHLEREEPVTSPAELELFTGENEHLRMSIIATGGIEAGFRRERDTLVYELRVPLSASATHPFGIGAGRGAVIGLGVVTSTLRGATELPIDRHETDGEPEGGFGGRRSGGGGGRGRGGSSPEAGPRTEQLNLWMKVRLAGGS